MRTMGLDGAGRRRVESLLGRMSLDRKIGQMTQAERLSVTPAEVRDHHLGAVLSGGGSTPGANRPADWVAMVDGFWEASAAGGPEQGAVPVLYGVDAVHGNSNVLGATVFPHNIGLGAAGDPELMERIARITARETQACGVDWAFAPTLAVARDDRWGRTYESYSEDPGIVASYAGRFVRALQADLGADGVVACAKHWVGDGGTTHGIDQGDAAIGRAELESLHVAPYRPAIEAGVLTVMASYSSWNGEKCHGHRYLLTDLLKGEMGFGGFVVSDWNGLDQLDEGFGEAVALGVNAGLDMAMVPENWREFIACLKEHVRRGRVPVSRIDDAVRRILTVKQACGLLDKPRPSERPGTDDPGFGSAAHRETAREAVRKSLVLLKNEGGLLPLDRGARILVAGRNAHDRGHQCGGWTVEWQGLTGNDRVEGGTSIWEGIARVAPNAVLSAGGTGAEADPRRHDAAVAVIGERPYAEGLGDVRRGDEVVVEQGSHIQGTFRVLEAYGDELSLSRLHPEDLATIRTIAARGVPVAAVLVSGRPLCIGPELQASGAFVAAWLPGSEGQGVADVLFGDHDFQGRLSFSWPREPGQSPNRGDSPYDPLFPYGFGLSYTG